MIRSLIKLALLVVVAILVYNYFFGDKAEKAQSSRIFGTMKTLVVEAGELVKSEKNKFDAGKYDGALAKLGSAYRAIRDRAQHLDQKVLTRLDELERRKATLEREIDGIQQADEQIQNAPAKGVKADAKAEQAKAAKAADQQRRKAELQKELEDLVHDTDELLNQAQE